MMPSKKGREGTHQAVGRPAGKASLAATSSPTSHRAVPASSRRPLPSGASPATQEQNHHQGVGDAIPAHSYTLALRSQWSSLVRLMRAHNSSTALDASGGGATMQGTAASAAALAVESGLDDDMCNVLSAIRIDAVNAAAEADALFPLLLALSIAPIPTEAVQTLAAEVLAKVIVAAHHGSASTRRMVEVFLVQNKVMPAMDLAMESSTAAHVSTSILELIFVIVTVSSASATALLADPAMLKHILGLLVSGVPAQVCYVAALLQTLARLPDAPQILCSYNAHHCILSFLYDNQEDDVTVTAVTMMLRVAVAFLQRCPAVFRQVFQQAPLIALLVRLLRSPWGDVADLGCLLVSSFLQQRTVAARQHSHHHSEGLASAKELESFATSILNCGGGGGGGVGSATVARRLIPHADTTVHGGQHNPLVVTLSSLCASPHRHLATSAAYALLLLSAHAVVALSGHLCADPTTLHNVVTTILEDADDDDNDGGCSNTKPKSLTNKDKGGHGRGGSDGAGEPARQQEAGGGGAAVHRALTAVVLCLAVAAGTAKGRVSFGQHVHRHLSVSTRTALCNRVRLLLSERVLQDSVFCVVEHVRPLLDTAAQCAMATDDEGGGRRLGLDGADDGGYDDVSRTMLPIGGRRGGGLLGCLRTTLVQKLEQWTLSDSAARYGAGGEVSSVPPPLDHSIQHLVRDEPRANVHSSSFIHNSIRVVIRLARNYTHSDAVRGGGSGGGGGGGASASTSVIPSTSHHRHHSNTTDSRGAVGLISSAASSTSTTMQRHLGTSTNNPWAPPHRHNVDRRWSVEHLQRDDVYLFDCPLEQLSPGLQDIMDGLTLHMAKLHHALNVCSMSHPLRRCVLLDLYTHVYPTMMTCCQYIAQSMVDHMSSNDTSIQTKHAPSAAVRVIADGGAHSVHSANILDVYHAIGLSTHFQ